MAVTKEDIVHIATLAHLTLPEEQLAHYTAQANRILEYVAQLNRVETKGIEPTSHAVEAAGFFRVDQARAREETAPIVLNAPARDGDLYRVPKVI